MPSPWGNVDPRPEAGPPSSPYRPEPEWESLDPRGYGTPQYEVAAKPPRPFPGFKPFIDQCSCLFGKEMSPEDHRVLSMARDSWHGKQIQQLLGQLPEIAAKINKRLLPESAALELITQLRRIYLSAVVLQEAIAFAILETVTNCELPYPEWLEDNPHGLRKPHDCGVKSDVR